MKGSVWYDEVYKGFIDLLPTIVTYKDSRGSTVPVPVIVRNPEADFKVEEFPCITLTIHGERFASERYEGDQYTEIVSKNESNFTYQLDGPAFPYDLDIQIDFWTEYQMHMSEITRKWAGTKGGIGFTLPVKDTLGNDRLSVVNRLGTAKANIVKKDKTIFHSIYDYRVWVELDELPTRDTKYVATVEIKEVVK